MWTAPSSSTSMHKHGSTSSTSTPVEIKVRNLDQESRDRSTTVSTATSISNPTPLSMGSLLRLFRSEFFDAFMAVTYLYRYRDSGGVHDYLCNQLYTLQDHDLETFMPQVCNLLVHHSRQSPALERFVMDKCADTMHIALQVFWFLQAAVEDAARRPDQNMAARVRLLRSRCETAAVNGSKRIMLAAAAQRISAATLVAVEPPFSPRSKEVEGVSLFSSSSAVNLYSKGKSYIHTVGDKDEVEDDDDGDHEFSSDTQKTTTHVDSRQDPSQLSSSADSSIEHDRTLSSEATIANSASLTTSTSIQSTATNSTYVTTLHSYRGYDDDDDDDDDDDNDDDVDNNNENNNDLDEDGDANDDTRNEKARTNPNLNQQLGLRKDDDFTNVENLGSSVQHMSINEKDGKPSPTGSRSDQEKCPVVDPLHITSIDDEQLPGDVLTASNEQRQRDADATTSHNDTEKKPDTCRGFYDDFERIPRRGPGEMSIFEDFDPLALLAMKQERCDYFNDSVSIAKAFVRLSLTTRDRPQHQRMAHLTKGLNDINDMLLRRMKGEPGEPLMGGAPAPDAHEVAKLGRAGALRSVHLPLTRASSQALRIVRVHTDEVTILTSRTRAPYRVNIEVLPTDMICSDKLLFCEHRVEKSNENTNGEESRQAISASNGSPHPSSSHHQHHQHHNRSNRQHSPGNVILIKRNTNRRLSEMTPAERQLANVRKLVYGDPYTAQPEVFAEAEERSDEKEKRQDITNEDYKSRQAVILGIYGELWPWKEKRILEKSPFSALEGTRLMPFIVKAGDDLRQEQLAIQLIGQLNKVFSEEGVHVYLKPFTVMSVSSEAGFVEVIKDAVSVHSLKKRTPNFVSLLNYFERAYGSIGTDGFRAAQRRFIRSMAGYSIVTYLLQIKDRHNGNIMIDALGHIIHIDFGFMLTNSPGAIKFENVPFKLTEEYLQVVCARENVTDVVEACRTEGYRYFQELFVLGLLAARKHYEKFTTLVEIMTKGTTMPCMTSSQMSGQAIVEALRHRFAVGMPEENCIKFALTLIEDSRLSWRSAGYDRFQAYSNGYR